MWTAEATYYDIEPESVGIRADVAAHLDGERAGAQRVSASMRSRLELARLTAAAYRDIGGNRLIDIAEQLGLGGNESSQTRSARRDVADGRRSWVAVRAWPWWAIARATGRPKTKRCSAAKVVGDSGGQRRIGSLPAGLLTRRSLQRQLDAFCHYYNAIRPHRALGGRTPLQAYSARIKAPSCEESLEGHFRVRHDKVDAGGTVTLRYDSKLHHIGLGRAHNGKPIKLLVADRDIRVLDAKTGEPIRSLTLGPSRDYQPIGGS
jgi:Integrase core domain